MQLTVLDQLKTLHNLLKLTGFLPFTIDSERLLPSKNYIYFSVRILLFTLTLINFAVISKSKDTEVVFAINLLYHFFDFFKSFVLILLHFLHLDEYVILWRRLLKLDALKHFSSSTENLKYKYKFIILIVFQHVIRALVYIKMYFWHPYASLICSTLKFGLLICNDLFISSFIFHYWFVLSILQSSLQRIKSGSIMNMSTISEKYEVVHNAFKYFGNFISLVVLVLLCDNFLVIIGSTYTFVSGFYYNDSSRDWRQFNFQTAYMLLDRILVTVYILVPAQVFCNEVSNVFIFIIAYSCIYCTI